LAVAAVLDVSAGEDAGQDVTVEGGETLWWADVTIFVEVEGPRKARAWGCGHAEEMKETGRITPHRSPVLEAQAFDVLFFTPRTSSTVVLETNLI